MKTTKKKPIENKPTNENKYKLMLCVNYDTKNLIDTKMMISKNYYKLNKMHVLNKLKKYVGTNLKKP